MTPTGTGQGARRCRRWSACRQRCWQKDWVLDLDVAQFFDSRGARPDGQSGGGQHHRPNSVGAAVCEAVAHRAAAAARRHPAAAGPGDPTRVSGLARAGEPVPALRVRSVPGSGVPDRAVRALCRRRGGALRDRAASPRRSWRALGQRGWSSSGCGCTPTRPGSCTARTTSGAAAHEHTSFTFLGYTFQPRTVAGRSGAMFIGFLARGQPAGAEEDGTTGPPLAAPPAHRDTISTELAEWINPIVAGWMNYYGRFYRSKLLSPPAAHQHLPDALGSAEIQTAAHLQRFHAWWPGSSIETPTCSRTGAGSAPSRT